MSIKEVAELVQMHPNTVRSWLRGELLPYTTGLKNEYLMRRRDLKKFMLRFYNENIDEE